MVVDATMPPKKTGSMFNDINELAVLMIREQLRSQWISQEAALIFKIKEDFKKNGVMKQTDVQSDPSGLSVSVTLSTASASSSVYTMQLKKDRRQQKMTLLIKESKLALLL